MTFSTSADCESCRASSSEHTALSEGKVLNAEASQDLQKRERRVILWLLAEFPGWGDLCLGAKCLVGPQFAPTWLVPS